MKEEKQHKSIFDEDALVNNETESNEIAEGDDSNSEEQEVLFEIDILKNQLLEKEKECVQNFDSFQRTLAEFENFRKRTIKEKASIYDDGVKDTIEKLLPVIDNFERAISLMEDKENSFYKGVEMIFRQFSAFLGDLGVQPIQCIGQTFDPNFHFAVAHVEDENVGANIVLEEMQKGYTLKGKVIRCSMVKVAN